MSHHLAADSFVAASGGAVHLLKQAPPDGGGGGGAAGPRAGPFAHVVVAHRTPVHAVRWNRNNKVVAAGSADGQVQLMYSSGQVMAVLPRDGAAARLPGAVTSVSWSAGSKRLAAGCDNGTAYLFDVAARGTKVQPTELRGHLGGVTALDFQHDDKFLAVASGGGSVVLYSDPHRTSAGGAAATAVPLHATADTSGRLCLALAAGGDPSIAAGSAAGSVTVWDVPSQRVREDYAEQHSGAVTAAAFAPLHPSNLYTAGIDGRVCLQDRRVGSGRAQGIAVGAPATAFMLREDEALFGVGTADGVVKLYDSRNVREPLHTIVLDGGQPITSLHWQHRFASLVAVSSRHRSSAAAAAPASARGFQPAAPSRLGMPPGADAAPAAAAALPAPSSSAPGAAPSIGSRIPAAADAAVAAAPSSRPAGNASRSAASRASAAASATPAAVIRAKLAASAFALHPPGRSAPAASASAPSSRSASPPHGAGAAAAPPPAKPRTASSQALSSQPLAPAASLASAAAQPAPAAPQAQVTPLHRPAAAPALAITPLPGMEPQHSSAALAAAAEVTPLQPPRGPNAGDAAQHLQHLTITPLARGTPHAAAAAAGQQQQQQQQQAEQRQPLSPLERLAAAPVDLGVTPLQAAPPARQPAAPAAAAAAPAGSAPRPGVPPPLNVTPLGDGGMGARAQLCISPLPGMQAGSPASAASASPRQRSVLGERTNSDQASMARLPSRHGSNVLPQLAPPLPAAPEAEAPPAVQASPSFAENLPLPLPSPGAARARLQQPLQQGASGSDADSAGLVDRKLKAAAAEAATAEAAVSTAASVGGQWSISAAAGVAAAPGRADQDMTDAAQPSPTSAAQPAAAALEFSFAAAQRSLEQLSSGAAWGGAAAAAAGEGGAAQGLPPALRDDILALHFDMLTQFQAQQAAMGQLVGQVLQQNEALSAEVAALRKQLASLTGRRNEFLWL